MRLPAAALALWLAAGGVGFAAPAYRIAVAAPLTGDMAPEAQSVRRGVELAVAEANASRTLPFLLEAVFFDDRADPREAVNVANLIAADGRVLAVVGHVNSGCCLPASRIYARAGIPMITPTAINSEVTSRQTLPSWVGPRVVFRLPPRDEIQGAVTARFCLQKLKIRDVAIIQDETPYGRGLAGSFRAALEAGGGRAVSEDGIVVGARDYAALVGRLAKAKPHAVFFGGLYTEFGLFLHAAQRAGLKAAFLSGSGSYSPYLFRAAGTAADGVYLAVNGLPPEGLPGYRPFLGRLRARFPGAQPTPFDHYGYAAAQVVLSGLRAAGPDRAALLTAIRTGRHETLLGPVEFDAVGDNRDPRVTMVRAQVAHRIFVAP